MQPIATVESLTITGRGFAVTLRASRSYALAECSFPVCLQKRVQQVLNCLVIPADFGSGGTAKSEASIDCFRSAVSHIAPSIYPLFSLSFSSSLCCSLAVSCLGS